MEGELKSEVKSEISAAVVDSTFDVAQLNEIKTEFSLSEPNSYDGLVLEHAVGSTYSGTSFLKMEEEVKSEVTSDVFETVFADSTSDVGQLSEIKEEFPLSVPHAYGGLVEHVVAEDDNMQEEFNVGQKFKTYKDLEDAISRYSKANSIHLWKRDARTANFSRVKRTIKKELLYYEIKYACVHGGREYKASGRGLRDVSTFRKDCPFFIRLRASEDGNSLEVTHYNLKHNHEIVQENYGHYPAEKMVSEDVKKLQLKANKKLVKEKLMDKTGKVILLKDLNNLTTATNNNLTHSIELIRKDFGATVAILKDKDSNFQGMFIQTPEMKNIFQKFPEFMAVNAMYKLAAIGLPVFLLLIEDGSCQSHVVAMSLLVSETKTNIGWFLRKFQEENPNWTETKCIITDKDMMERNVIKTIFPDVSLILCIFHTMRIFRREIKCEKMGITETEKNTCLEFLQHLVYAKSDEEFEKNYNGFKEIAPKPVYEYYMRNWHHSKHEWSLDLKFCKGNFLNNTNNKLETISSKLKDVISTNSSLDDFLEGFFKLMFCMENERQHKMVYSQLKRAITKFPKESAEQKYMDFLTKETAKQVIKQIEYSKIANNIVLTLTDDHFYLIKSSEETFNKTNLYKCSCTYYNAMLLPCRHIFALRTKLNEPLFDPNLPNKRWTVSYNKNMTTNQTHSNNGELNGNTTCTIVRPPPVITYAQKRKAILPLTNSLADLAAQRSNMHFERRKLVISNLKKLWESGVDVKVVPIEENDLQNDLNDVCKPCTDENVTEGGHEREFIMLDKSEVPPEDDLVLDTIELDVNQENLTQAATIGSVIPQESLENVSLLESSLMTSNMREGSNNSDNQEQHSTTHICLMESLSKMSQKIKKRGRVKTQDRTTAIELPKRKKQENKPTPYSKLSLIEKELFILKNISNVVVQNLNEISTLEKEQLRLTTELLPYVVLDNDINLDLIRKYLSDDAWIALTSVIEEKRKELQAYPCKVCGLNTEQNSSLSCIVCLLRHHPKCAGSQQRTSSWICRDCLSLN